MRPGLIIRGRRYWDMVGHRYVTSINPVKKRDGTVDREQWLVHWAGVVYSVKPRYLTYLAPEDQTLCQDLADAAKMDWFDSEFDSKLNEERNRERDDRGHLRHTSYRNAVKVLSEGLIDQNFLDIEYIGGRRRHSPLRAEYFFRKLVEGMGFDDPGPYFKED